MATPKVLSLPVSRPAKEGASRLEIWRERLRFAAGKVLRTLGVPGVVQSTTINDAVTGQHIDVSVGILFTRVSVDGRDYYFDRFTGRLDGSGLTLKGGHGGG